MNGAGSLRSIMRSFCGERQQIKEVFKVGSGMALNTEYYRNGSNLYIQTSELCGEFEEMEIQQVLAISFPLDVWL